jgi:hypothetical protein
MEPSRTVSFRLLFGVLCLCSWCGCCRGGGLSHSWTSLTERARRWSESVIGTTTTKSATASATSRFLPSSVINATEDLATLQEMVMRAPKGVHFASRTPFRTHILQQEGDLAAVSPQEMMYYDDDNPFQLPESYLLEYPNEFCFDSASGPYKDFECVSFMRNVSQHCLQDPSQLVYDEFGYLSAEQTFYQCLSNILDSGMPATFLNGTFHGCTKIWTMMTMLNLVAVCAKQEFVLNFATVCVTFSLSLNLFVRCRLMKWLLLLLSK